MITLFMPVPLFGRWQWRAGRRAVRLGKGVKEDGKAPLWAARANRARRATGLKARGGYDHADCPALAVPVIAPPRMRIPALRGRS